MILILAAELSAWWCNWCELLNKENDETCIYCNKKKGSRPVNEKERLEQLYEYAMSIKHPHIDLCNKIYEFSGKYLDRMKKDDYSEEIRKIFIIKAFCAINSNNYREASESYVDLFYRIKSVSSEKINNINREDYLEDLLYKAFHSLVKFRDYSIDKSDYAWVRGANIRMISTAELYEKEFPAGRHLPEIMRLHASILIRSKKEEDAVIVLEKIISMFPDKTDLSLFAYQSILSLLTDLDENYKAASYARKYSDYARKNGKKETARRAAESELYQYIIMEEKKRSFNPDLLFEFIRYYETTGYDNLVAESVALLFNVFLKEKDAEKRARNLEKLLPVSKRNVRVYQAVRNELSSIYFGIGEKQFRQAEKEKNAKVQSILYFDAGQYFIRVNKYIEDNKDKKDLWYNIVISNYNSLKVSGDFRKAAEEEKKRLEDSLNIISFYTKKLLLLNLSGKEKQYINMVLQETAKFKKLFPDK